MAVPVGLGKLNTAIVKHVFHIFVLLGAQNFDVIRFATYRTACKLRFIQKKTNCKRKLLLKINNLLAFSSLKYHYNISSIIWSCAR